MYLKQLIFLTIVVLLCTEVCGECTCNKLQGDYCSCKEHIPRPQQRPSQLIASAKQYLPIGDTCSCGHTIVQPAIPPRPACASVNLEPPQRIGCQEKTLRAPESLQGSHVDPSVVYGNKLEHKALPADAVSLSLAYQLARSLRKPVPEDKIQYGFRTQPINGLIQKLQTNIPEEKLWAMNRAIVELKGANAPGNPEEDDDEDEIAQQEARSPGYLSYGDIGYCPEKYPNKAFNIQIPSLHIDVPCSDIAPKLSDNYCGYQPGKITVSHHEDFEHRGIEDCLEH